jgi:hypothetical protein
MLSYLKGEIATQALRNQIDTEIGVHGKGSNCLELPGFGRRLGCFYQTQFARARAHPPDWQLVQNDRDPRSHPYIPLYF